jgi:hypothetical protein
MSVLWIFVEKKNDQACKNAGNYLYDEFCFEGDCFDLNDPLYSL